MMGHSTSVLVPYSCFGFRPSPIPRKGQSSCSSPLLRPMSIVVDANDVTDAI